MRVLDAVFHPLTGAFRAVEERARTASMLSGLEMAMKAEGLGVLLIGPGDRITEMRGPVREYLESYFGPPNGLLPDALEFWLASQRQRRGGLESFSQPPEPFVVERGDRRLEVRLLESPSGPQLLLQERTTRQLVPDPALGLTGREAEVLRLVAEGLTNRQTAVRLRVTANTVRKHLENAYAKLGVGTRTAAIARAFGPDRQGED